MKNIILFIALIFQINITIAQSIEFTNIPAWGSYQNLKGKVNNTNITDNKVLVYIYVEGTWWVKPYSTAPLTSILPDSTWECDVTTGGIDQYAKRYIAFIVPNGFIIPGGSFVNELPEELYNYTHVLHCRLPGTRIIDFCGYNWVVKQSEAQIGPDFNYWTDDENDVYIDENDKLHLSIINKNEKWYCSEVIADTTLGYGIYSFKINTQENITPYSVLGMFTWDEYSNTDYYKEIDIELSQWGNSQNDNFQYVNQPWNNPANMYRFNIIDFENTIHKFISLKEDSSIINSWLYTGEDYHEPSSTVNPRINLWLHQHYPPQQNINFIISNFYFNNLLNAPTGVDASDGTDSVKVVIQWDEAGDDLYYGIYRNIENNLLTVTLLNTTWIDENYFEDTAVSPNMIYYYFIRSSDNITGSNVSGYASDFSEADSGWVSNYSLISEFDKISYINIHPNPFDQEVMIEYTLEKNCFLKILLIDVYGNLITTILEENKKAGKHYLRWIPKNNLKQGIYFLNIIINGQLCKSKKLIFSDNK